MVEWGKEDTDPPAGESQVVLLVEDEMIIAFDMADQLTDAGFEVDGPYPSNAKALEAIRARRPDVAILDMQLTDGDVFPVARELKSLDVPIVFHSGHANPADLKTEFPSAIVCTKPCPNAKLQSAVLSVVASRQDR